MSRTHSTSPYREQLDSRGESRTDHHCARAEDMQDRSWSNKGTRASKRRRRTQTRDRVRRFQQKAKERKGPAVPRGQFGHEGVCARCDHQVRSSLTTFEPHYWYVPSRKGNTLYTNTHRHVSEMDECLFCKPCFEHVPKGDYLTVKYYSGTIRIKRTRCDLCCSTRFPVIQGHYFSRNPRNPRNPRHHHTGLRTFRSWYIYYMYVCHKCTKQTNQRPPFLLVTDPAQITTKLSTMHASTIHPTRSDFSDPTVYWTM